MSLTLHTPISVPQRGLLVIRGEDSHKFLQGQVTCDVKKLVASDGFSLTCLGAHCTPKGRMLFSFRAIELDTETIALDLPLTLLESALQRLKKYSIFYKVTLVDAREDYSCLLLHRSQLDAIAETFSRLPTGANVCVQENGHLLIQLSENYFQCWFYQQSTSAIVSTECARDDEGYWDAVAIALGVGEVRPETVELFIPQMLNLQVLANGISFTKGCYTGQEIVARMQYLGKLKRRMYRLRSDMTKPLAPGSPVYTLEHQQTVGHVVLSTALNQELLAVLAEDAVNANQVYADTEHQHQLAVLSLPYLVNE